ncbi:unnamed protein product, partial [Adineta ricciae]
MGKSLFDAEFDSASTGATFIYRKT